LIVKHKFYLYLPYVNSEIVSVFIHSNWKELHGKRLDSVKDTKHLWGVAVHLNPNIMNIEIIYQFGVEKCEGQKSVIKLDKFIHTLDSSTVQRKYWMRVSTSGVLDHVQHIMHHCKEDMKDSILQLEVLIADIQHSLNISEILSILNQLAEDSLVNNYCSLIFALLLAKLKYFSFVKKSNENLVTKLFQTLCLLNRSDLPSTSIRCLHELSYYVMAKKLKSKFCLVHWMTYMFPFQSEATFIQEINRFLKVNSPIAINDKESLEMTLEICIKVRARILKEKSEKGPEFVLALVKHLPLEIAMKVHSDIFDDMSDLVQLGEKIQDSIVVKIKTKALMHVNSKAIDKMKSLWKMVKSQRYINRLIGTFEKYLLLLFNRMSSFNNNYKGFFEDEVLFVDEPNKDVLLQLIAVSPIREVHEYMKTLTPGKKFLTISDDIVEKWFETALDKYVRGGVFSHAIKSMYTYLCDAILLQQPGNNADLTRRLETKLYNMKIRSLKPAELVKMADEIFSATKGSKLAHEIFLHHLERLLKEKCNSENPRDILTNIFGKDILLGSGWQIRLLTTLLDSYALKAVSQTEDTIFTLLPHQNFWKAVLKVQGEVAKKVKKHPSYIAADECISSLRKSLKDMTISICFLEKIASENLILEVASILSDDGFPKEQCLYYMEDYHSCVMKERERTVHVKITLENIIKYFPAPDDSGLLEIKEKVHMISETLNAGNIIIKEMKESLWKPYDDVPLICEKLKTPSKSSVYWRVCLKNNIGKDKATNVQELGKSEVEEDIEKEAGWQEDTDVLELVESQIKEKVEVETGWQEDTDDENMNYSDVYNIHDENGMPVLNGLTVLKDLYEKGCDLYKEIWEDFYKGSNIPISYVQEMFGHGVNIPEEIGYIEDFEGNSLSNVSKSALLAYWNFPNYENTVKAMEKSLAAFKIYTVDEEVRSAIQAFKDLAEGDADSITIFQVHSVVKTVEKTSNMLSEGAIELLICLGESPTLVGFLSDIVDEDIRNLIDAVEEVSETFVNESTMSGLIEVKRFLHPFLIKDSHLRQNQTIFFRAFAEKFKEMVFKDAVLKTTDCMENLHNLKSLYNNVANRSERTREITKSIIENGKFNFSLQHHECMLTVSYQRKETFSKHLKATLVELRSRALLLMNTARKEDPEDETEDKQEYLGKYVTCIDLGLEIAKLCTGLYVAGHFSFTKFDTQIQPDQLEECRSKLKEELIAWQKDIMQCREKYYYMNFLNGGQIQVLYNYIQAESIEGKRAVDTFLKFIHPNVSVEAVGKYITQKMLNESNQKVLMNMGMALEQACKKLLPVRRPIELLESSLHITDSIQKMKLIIISLDQHSKSVVRTVLSLYQNITHVMPEAHQVLFCRRETVWDEIDLLLKRCLGASKFGRGDSLFCLANVELLSNDNQFQLVDALRKLPKDGTFMLAIIFRGAEHHPFLHEFSESVTQIHPMTEASLQMCLEKECPEVFTVTSEVPGLGKTESIKRHAHKIGKTCITLHISGPLNKYTLVERLSNLNIKEDCVLHIDIGNTPNTEEFDTFLFELLLLHFVSAYTTSVFLTTTSVCIEIANTMNNTLSNSLYIATSFKRKHIQWKGFESFQVSNELLSSIQVICHYLNAVEDGTLDKRDIVFKGTKAPEPLPIKNCIFLLQKYFLRNELNEEDSSFNLINSFIRVLADQLKKMSRSSYFRISKLSLVLGRKNRPPVKTDLVKAMIKVCLDFAGKSIKGCRQSQISTAALSSQMTNLATSLASSVEGMIRWEDTNHLMFLFHSQDIQTWSVLYRSISDVPEDVKTLFKIQNKELLDFGKLNQKELQDILQKVARSNPKCIPPKELIEMAKYYALTPDNLLKMVLIILRIRAHIPVIVMGDTGCGKTSLIQYLSKICDVEFIVKTIHAGIEEKDIITAVEDANRKALQSLKTRQQVWLFLDEINTSDHICLLSDIICHHSCLGRRLAPNFVLLSACNPYRLRSESAIHTAGLADKAKTDELSRLLYRVHPLPETMVDYVWDFGSLSKTDEKMYIEQMVCGKLAFSTEKETLLADALVISQQFIRTVEKVNCCVSLRDVRRCTDLAVWFKEEFLQKKKNLKATVQKGFYNSSDIEIRAIILALVHCYHSRLIDLSTREKYREALFSAFSNHQESKYGVEKIKKIIQEEQEDILDRMELPPGVAKNTALQENVFVILVCILNRIPIFVVGKPGCSKSLSMQVIRSNLRGPDSKDELFKLLPQLYCVSFQGSESSTSDGIIKVFEKAQKYQESNSQEDVLSVVILDEIGLAEVSRFNPLKVLHSLLEPHGKPQPDVAVVGISNWVLDASKMNRAIHLSRPEMDEEELILTGKSISDSFAKSSYASYSGINPKQERNLNISEELKGIASGYFEFVSNQRFRNFFGLRDYYSLVKYFARKLANMTDYAINQDVKGKIILKGIHRNFGGLFSEMGLVRKCFEKHIIALHSMHSQHNISVLDLIKENVNDRSARHLLLITTGDSVLGILEKQLKDQGREHVTIYGSKFEEDLTDDYSYRILSRIILCMEQGLVLILKDLETVYGSLYDMLNQNYTIVGNKKNCRIALGPYSNPMCYVHDDFRCIVLVEESELDHSDPPFLNRFEKQSLQYSEILGDENAKVVLELNHWVNSVTSVSGKHFSPEDIIPIYSTDMISTLVLYISDMLPSEYQSVQKKIKSCKLTLLQVMKPEAIARIGMTEYGKTCSAEELEEVKQVYFQMPIHEGLEHFLQSEIGSITEGVGEMLIVFTNSNIHTDLKKMVPGFKCQIEKLGAFKSEKQLTMQMEQFWHSSEKQILFLQFKADTDGTHILLSKSIIEKLHAEYRRGNSKIPKHVCLVVHLGRRTEEAKTVPQIDFLAKWKLFMLDSLSRPKMKLPELLKWNLIEIIELKKPLNDYIKEQLFAAFTCIRYGTAGRSINSITHIITEISKSPEFISHLEGSVLKWIEEKFSSSKNVDNWQVQVACDANALYTASSFIEALERHILSIIFNPLAMLIYELEKQNLLDSFFVSDLSAKNRRHMWYTFFHGKKTFTIDKTPLPEGPECYAISTPFVKLHMPFSKLCFERIEKERDFFSKLLRSTLLKYEVDDVEGLDSEVVEGLCFKFSDMISCKLGELLRLEYENCQMDYVHDFCTLVVARQSPEDINDEKINVMFQLLPHRCKLPGLNLNDACTFIHTTYWTNFSLIMAEFMLIETCRELVDIKGVLHEIFTVIDADIESDQMKDEEGNKEKEASLSTSDVLSSYLSDQESNKESIDSIKSDDELFAIEENKEIRSVSSSEYEFLEQIGEEAETLPKIISDDFDGRNVNFCSGHVIQSESKRTDRLEVSCTTESDEKDKDGYNINLDTTVKSSNEIEENLDACNSVNIMFEEKCKGHELRVSQENVDNLLKQKETLDGKNKDVADLELAEYTVSESVDEGSAHEWIRDSHMMGINSVADISEIAADSFPNTNDKLSYCSGYILQSGSEHNYTSEADFTSEGEKKKRDKCNETVHAALSDTRSSNSILSDKLDVNDRVSRMSEERHGVHLNLESTDTLLEQEDTLDGEKKITVYPVSKSLDEGSAHDWIRESHVNEINSRSLEKPEEDEGNSTITKSLEGAIRTKSGEEQRNAPPAFQHVWVEKLCKKILPSAGMLKSEKDLANWNIKVQSILTFASCVSQDCNVFYGLRFCSDLTSLVLIPYKMDTFWLVQLGNMLQRDVAMDTEEFMEKISEMIIFFGSSSITEQDRQKIFSQFILRCLQAYEDSNVIDWFIYMVERNAVPDGQLTYLKNPLHYAYFMEMTGNMSQNIFCQVLDLDQEEACQVMQESNILSSFHSNIQNQLQTSQHNIPLAVLLVDVFEQEIFHLLHPDIETLMTETAVERLLKVERIIFTEEFSLRQLLAIAYFRRFVKTLGVDLQKKEQELNQAYFQKLNACLRGNENEEGSKRLSLQLFLLKVLKSRLRFAQFNKMCQNLSGKLTFISSLWKCKSLVDSIDNAPLALYNLNCHEHAIKAFKNGNDELKTFIRNAIANSDQMLSLHSVLIEQLFLKRTVMELTDDDRNKANEVEKFCKECEMDEYNFRLIQFHLGKKDYEVINCLNLNLHQGSSEIDMQIATFVIELASLALSSRITGCNFVLKCFLEPEEFLGAFLPGITGKEIRSKLSATKVFLGRCTSHHRFASNIYMTEDQCPQCLNAVVEKNALITETLYSFEFGMNELVPGTMLTTISQQLLLMIIHGLLTASLATGYSRPNQISGLLQKGEDEGGVAKYLYQSVQKAFRYLEDLMEMRQTDLDYFLHVLLSKTRTLLCKACPAFTVECERNVWEKEFTHIVNSLIHDRFAAVREGKRQVLTMHGLDETAIEYQVEEIGEVGWCPYLFRLTSEPSLENLSFELYQENNADSFPFLALVLKALPQLELIQQIKPLISWHKACVTYASYHKKKADCLKSEYKVSIFIHEEDDKKKREMLIKKFDLLKKAWKTIREQAASVKALPVMERLHNMSKLENCLILDKSSCMYKVLEVLVSIQNNFLDETLALAVQKYVPALHFLQKNTTCASLPCVPVADIKKDHIINFKWSEHYLKFSQSNIQYGHGRKIAYDFRTIEMELANSLILEKGHLLLEESFPRIFFSDELYRIYILMIQELKGVIPQQKLTLDIEAGIQSRRERDPNLIADFLNHLGIIISLLRRTGGRPETPLVEFIDNWSYVLTRQFPKQVLPNPENAIQLCHIVELNELLEEMNADGVIESLGDEYRVPLDEISHTIIDEFLSSSVLLAKVILKAEKRFVHRCLLHREVSPMDSLMNHLKDQYFWPEGLLSNGWLQVGSHGILLADVFPADVRVQHINSYLQFLMTKIE
ncbi:hypothetical protein ACJMK2_016635, partial [Sinanodonta woodiana]